MKLYFTKNKTTTHWKTNKKMKRQPEDWEEMLTIHMSDKGLLQICSKSGKNI